MILYSLLSPMFDNSNYHIYSQGFILKWALVCLMNVKIDLFDLDSEK